MLIKLYRLINKNKGLCFYIGLTRKMSKEELEIVQRTLQAKVGKVDHTEYTEVGVKLNFVSPFSTNAVELFTSIGFDFIYRIEKSTMYLKGTKFSYDKLLEEIYPEGGLHGFDHGVIKKDVVQVPLRKLGRFSKEEGLAFDVADLRYYRNLFKKLKRDPTDVELFDLAQSNSEHSRHWHFNGRLFLNGEELDHTLFDLIKYPLKVAPENSVIAFSDNSSAINGSAIKWMHPTDGSCISPYVKSDTYLYPTYTAETHNFPTGVSPFPGAATGTGGRIRDGHSIGKGGMVIASVVGYCVGNLYLDHFEMEWEKRSGIASTLAPASRIEIEASDGASDYGNKFGEPVVLGFTRSFGQWITGLDGEKERIEWIKPIMFSGGIGQTFKEALYKESAQVGDCIVRIGGPAYRIGIGGGSASSRADVSSRDLAAVQRGDPEMGNKLNRVVRSCIELFSRNPIRSIHDQGAGGMGNVTKEIVEGCGGKVELERVVSGDPSLSAKEIWISEHQEQDCLLTDEEGLKQVVAICKRERLPVACVGRADGSGKIVATYEGEKVVDLPLNKVLSDLPQKEYELEQRWYRFREYTGMETGRLLDHVERVFTLLSVGSKRFLVNKVDRSVTGLIAQQQCVGACQVPISDYSVVAQSYFGYRGICTSVGEQPIKGIINSEIMARLCVGEMLTNMMGCSISAFEDIKCSGNWMWPIEFPGEKQRMYQAVKALSECLTTLGIAIDGGKDSLSMSHNGVKSPGTLVMSGYVGVPDIRIKADPGFKNAGNSIYLIQFNGKCRMGGSAFMQTLNKLGKLVPDLEDPLLLKKCFNLVQTLIKKKVIVSCHDRSDGGLITCLAEMGFANQIGMNICLDDYGTVCGLDDYIALLFNEELGVVVEVTDDERTERYFKQRGLSNCLIKLGNTVVDSELRVEFKEIELLRESLPGLQLYWELTSFNLERKQTKLECCKDEYATLNLPKLVIMDGLEITHPVGSKRYPICILREEGCNGDREMAAAFYHAGFRPWDICMSDLVKPDVSLEVLDQFKGIAFVGGFSYADVFGAGRGWTASVLYNKRCKAIFDRFREREDSFSLGVCNGCQLMSYIDWIPHKVRFVKNRSGRFESRCSAVKICKSRSIMFKGMEGSVLNVWIAHGEGNVNVPVNDDTVCMRYVDEKGEFTERYPYNPNGSVGGVTGICSDDGRHLAIMPHIERSFLNWQLPYGGITGNYSPWFQCFVNAYNWCQTMDKN